MHREKRSCLAATCRDLVVGVSAVVMTLFASMASAASGAAPRSAAPAMRVPPAFTVEPSRRMHARGLDWDHEIRIALPASYSKTQKSYPVLWVMDGGFMFEHAVLGLSILGPDVVPEMIVVGVGAPPEVGNEHAMRRFYDFTPPGQWGFEGFGSDVARKMKDDLDRSMQADGMPLMNRSGGAAAFLAFLVDTVRPALARDYRMTDSHTLYGESAGGLFCVHALFARPEAFSKYVCVSPGASWGNYMLLRTEEQYSRTHKDLPAEVFLSAGEREAVQGGLISAGGTVSATARLAEMLTVRNYPSLKLHFRIFPGEDHGSIIPANFAWGLRALWADELGSP